MSPKTSSLAFDELKVDVSSEEVEIRPELSLIISKRKHLNTDAPQMDRPIAISGCFSVSF